MEPIKRNLPIILNMITLLTCFCGIAFGWGKMNTRVDNIENRQVKLESAIMGSEVCQREIFFKLGVLEGKIDALALKKYQ